MKNDFMPSVPYPHGSKVLFLKSNCSGRLTVHRFGKRGFAVSVDNIFNGTGFPATLRLTPNEVLSLKRGPRGVLLLNR